MFFKAIAAPKVISIKRTTIVVVEVPMDASSKFSWRWGVADENPDNEEVIKQPPPPPPPPEAEGESLTVIFTVSIAVRPSLSVTSN